ncbi:MAG: RNA ligase family protein [Cyanobacteria bacterium P01_F01_bin.150]
MPVIVMTVNEVSLHPNADSLRVYQMSAPAYGSIQIIANLDNCYEKGDRVVVALTDSVLKDGTKIKPTKLRGLSSSGMAMGKTEEDVGIDLSAHYCQKSLTNSGTFIKWPSIELLHNLCRSMEYLEEKPTLTYRAKVKLDGTNAGVQISPEGQLCVQSRTQLITPKKDNMGFAAWVNEHLAYFSGLAGHEHITVFGEWCGKGIQNRTAISQIERRVFAVFAIQYGGINGHVAKLEVSPEQIRDRLPSHPDIFVLPFYGEPIKLDFSSKEQLKIQAEHLSQWVDAVEHSDPWVKETFGLEGLGEGLVMYPMISRAGGDRNNGHIDAGQDDGHGSRHSIERLGYSELLFKAKGLKHHVAKVKKPVQVDPEKVKGINEFVTLFVTEVRLEQGATEACGGEFSMKKMGVFLKWLTNDVQKESKAELEASQLTWKEVNKAVMNAARDWYRKKATAL